VSKRRNARNGRAAAGAAATHTIEKIGGTSMTRVRELIGTILVDGRWRGEMHIDRK